MTFDNIDLFPVTAGVNDDDRLTLGGCDATELVAEFGSPLLVFDEDSIRTMCRQFVDEFTARYPDTSVVYASKAFINAAIAKLVAEEDLGLDVVSGGELAVAKAADMPMERVYFHGNNKTPDELEFAVDSGIGRIVIDNFYELRVLNDIAKDRGVTQEVTVRLSPNVDPHTHAHTTTGILDSKFGFAIETGDAVKAIRDCLAASNLDLVGVHFHLGSPIFELEPYAIAIDTVLTFIAPFKDEGLNLREFSPGGGFAIGYVRDELPPRIADYAEVITNAFRARCADLGLGEPRLLIEPGRSIVGRAGVALYTVGAIKDIPSVRKYVSLDGGMGDNIRPALYDAKYEAVVANRMSDAPEEVVTLAGKYCESGDVLIRDIELPVLEPRDIVAIPSSGAYVPSMASNYNLNPRPAIVMVGDGSARLIRRRESYANLMAMDVT
ncbi:MAG: diaminopimelate decarboxylase [SAR202 cluster bacterium]|jgi:diaminopimelate decarboxylase|nr:diaminopimelate decarboxylase [SAR202 cluster bacterium]MDP6299894.1 diaminopimelate decarboxylase [SAR202 cluster bacterium]